jgi:putative nucleotidyltransferase with HDIG domain
MRLLLVDDDERFRALLRTTCEAVEVEVDEAADAEQAAARIAARRPDVVVLDVHMPRVDGLSFCRRLKEHASTCEIGVVLLTGLDDVEHVAAAAGADAFLRKPFRPLELLSVVERVAAGHAGLGFRPALARSDEEQLLLYARDLRHLVELERGQRALLESAYAQTVSALTSALEWKDTGTGAHARRVQRYASELAHAIDPVLADQPSLQYGFLLHDIGKIAIPDEVLGKPGPLTDEERRLMQTHTVLGAQMLGGVAFLEHDAVEVVRSHHERWEGSGYPDRLSGEQIPLAARIFAVADTLDAITSHRPYREAQTWRVARRTIVAEAGKQFDPDVVDAFRDREFALHEIRRELLSSMPAEHRTPAYA